MRRIPVWHLLPLLLVLICLSASAVGAQTGKIQGRLLIAQNPISDETVVLKDASGRICNGTMTDEQGGFVFAQVPAGIYTLVGRFNDYEAEIECTVIAGEQVSVTLSCKKKSLFQWIPDAMPLVEYPLLFT